MIDAAFASRASDDSAVVPRRLFWVVVFVIGAAFWVLENQWHFTAHDTTLDPEEQVEQYTGSGEAIRRFGFLMVGGLGLYLLTRQDGLRVRLDKPAAWTIFLLLAWAAASMFWTEDSSMTSRRLIIVFLCVVGALGIARYFDGRALAMMMIAIGAAYGCIALVSELTMGAFQPWSGDHRFSGTAHPNVIGLYLSTLCLALICMRKDLPNRGLFVALLTTAGALLLFTRSRTSLIALVGGLTALWLLGSSRSVRGWLGLGIAWLASIAGIILGFLDAAAWRSVFGIASLGREENVGSLTGRTPLWAMLMTYVEQRPWQGFGYQAFWSRNRCEEIFAELDWSVSHAHNGYLEATLGLGLIGLLLLLAAIVAGLSQAKTRCQSSGQSGDVFLMALFAYAIVHAVFEATFVQPVLPAFIVGCGLFRLMLIDVTAPATALDANSRVRWNEPTLAERGFVSSPRWGGESS